MAARHKPLDRRRRGILLTETLRMLRTLYVGRWTVDALAAETGVHRRTAYRMLSAIEAEGLRIDRQREDSHVYYRISREDVRKVLGMALDEALETQRTEAISAAEKLADVLHDADLPMPHEVRAALDSLERALEALR